LNKLENGISEGTGHAEGRERGADTADEDFLSGGAVDDKAGDELVFSGADDAAGGDVY
jgi:hypothetical protein